MPYPRLNHDVAFIYLQRILVSYKRAMSLFSKEYDFSELERVTEYEGEYSAETPVIRQFWSVVHEMPEAEQRQLLQFATGSDRIPIGGMSHLKFVIARQGPDSDRWVHPFLLLLHHLRLLQSKISLSPEYSCLVQKNSPHVGMVLYHVLSNLLPCILNSILRGGGGYKF